jgi:hypothetical protein
MLSRYLKVPILVIGAAVAFFIFSCTKPYQPKNTKYESMVIIDAMLTDDGRAKATVMLSYPLKGWTPERINDAKVSIWNIDGQSWPLELGKEAGIYENNKDTIGLVGQSYYIVAEVRGKLYQSEPEIMLPVADITGLSFRTRYDGMSPVGIDLLLSSEGDAGASKYFGWSFEETWKFRAPMFSSNFHKV